MAGESTSHIRISKRPPRKRGNMTCPPSEQKRKEKKSHSPITLSRPRKTKSNDHIQIPITASLFFASHTTLWLIKIRYAAISASAKWEDPPNDNDGCPHLYGSLEAADVSSVEKFDRPETGAWKDVFAASSWLN